jgi:hypothetical protein
MNTRLIMVQLADAAWTRQAMHLASAMAYRTHAEVVLVRFMAVPHIGLVGEDMGDAKLSKSEQEIANDCRVISEEYHVQLHLMNFQFYALTDALVDAAAHIDAQAVFASIPTRLIPYWQRFELWNLRRRLDRIDCELYTLEPTDSREKTAPSMLIRAARK